MEIYVKWKIREERFDKALTDDLEIHIIELPKAKWEEMEKSKLIQLLAFLDNPNKMEVLEMKKIIDFSIDVIYTILHRKNI